MIKLPREKMAKLNDENVTTAEKIDMFDCSTLPKGRLQNELIAQDQRKDGNRFFTALQFEEAIQSYNQSVSFSSSSEFRGIMFANRAAAYLKLHSYQDCLDSIRLAKECPLPAKIMMKVLAREKVAIEGLELYDGANEASCSDMPIELSYRRHKRIPSFVFCLKLKEAGNPYGGIITTKDLLPGDVLVIEPPLTKYTRSLGMCNNCFRSCGSLQPCKCGIMFCSPECKKEAFDTYHNFECPLMEYLITFSYVDGLILRVFFKLIQRFEDFARLREYLENIIAPNPFDGDDIQDWPDVGNFLSQFRLFYATERPSVKNCIDQRYNNLHTTMAKAAVLIDILKQSKEIPCIAKGADEWAFLSEQLFRLFCYKTFTARSVAKSVLKYHKKTNNEVVVSSDSIFYNQSLALYGSASLFRVSCLVNIVMDYRKEGLIVRAIECIPRGTELLAWSS